MFHCPDSELLLNPYNQLEQRQWIDYDNYNHGVYFPISLQSLRKFERGFFGAHAMETISKFNLS